MPYSIRTLSSSGSNLILYPSFRKIHFDDSPHIVTVSYLLRLAWPALSPGDDITVDSFMRTNSRLREEERNEVPKNPDTSEIHSAWRRRISYLWNHVFYDIGNFLAEVGPGIGCMVPPADDVLAVNYPEPVEAEGLERVWEGNDLVLPAYLEPGISIRMAFVEGGVETTVGTFHGSNSTELWFIKEDTKVRIFVEGEYDKDRRGLAALSVYGKLTKNEEEEDEDEEHLAAFLKSGKLTINQEEEDEEEDIEEIF